MVAGTPSTPREGTLPGARRTSGWLVERALSKGTTENGVIGTKIMWAYFRDFVRLARRRGLQDVRPCEVPAAVLPNLGQFVWMHRRDTTRQAVSLWKALQTQQWRRDSDEDIGGRGLRFSFAAIDHLKLRIDEHNAAWQDFFYGCGVEPIEVVYEELVEDYEGTVLWLLDGIGVPVPGDFHRRRAQDAAAGRRALGGVGTSVQ